MIVSRISGARRSSSSAVRVRRSAGPRSVGRMGGWLDTVRGGSSLDLVSGDAGDIVAGQTDSRRDLRRMAAGSIAGIAMERRCGPARRRPAVIAAAGRERGFGRDALNMPVRREREGRGELALRRLVGGDVLHLEDA